MLPPNLRPLGFVPRRRTGSQPAKAGSAWITLAKNGGVLVRVGFGFRVNS